MQAKPKRSRRSHSKSFKGCSTCKKRHVRCDQTHPECENCKRYGARCGYLDKMPVTDNTPLRSHLSTFMQPNEEAKIEAWYRTGIPPYPDLLQCTPNKWPHMPKEDLWLLHSLTSASIDLHKRGLGGCTVWAQQLPMFLNIAVSNESVMSALLALSGFLMAHLTQTYQFKALAMHHRSKALAGLSNALNSFPNINHDGLLAASLLIAWQAPDRSSWITMQKSISTVLQSASTLWKPQSEITQFIRSRRALAIPSTWFQPDGNFDYLDQVIQGLQVNRDLVSHNPILFDRLGELTAFFTRMRWEIPNQTPDTIFERIQSLQEWLFWLPISMSRDCGLDIITLAVLAQFFAAGMALSPFCPQTSQTGDSFLCALSVEPLNEISQVLAMSYVTDPLDESHHLATLLMQAPIRILEDYFRRSLTVEPITDGSCLYQQGPCTIHQAHAEPDEAVEHSFQTPVNLWYQDAQFQAATPTTSSQNTVHSQSPHGLYDEQSTERSNAPQGVYIAL
ncbi:hypothetical protein N7540_011030 [Penicillium herquei]|nr:hypothetical protein N7540_011030 [Penicillium herquei]